jgi:hypothetical protein
MQDVEGIITLTISASNLDPDARYVVQSHMGSCEHPSASFGSLGALETNAVGNGSLTATAMATTGVGIRVSLDPLLNGQNTITAAGPSSSA